MSTLQLSINKNNKVLFQVFLGIILLLGGIAFFMNQRTEVIAAVQLINHTSFRWLAIGAVLSIAYIVVHGLIYRCSFKTLSCDLSMSVALELFLKRNFVSVFLPAGGFTSIALFRKEIEKQGISRPTTDFASVIYTLLNLLSITVLSFFVLFYWGIQNASESFLIFLASSIGFWVIIACSAVSFYKKGILYRLTVKFFPSAELFHSELLRHKLSMKPLIMGLFWALIIELIGLLHLYVAMFALNIEPSFDACLIVYAVATLFYCFSPFLKGVGIVEVSMVLLLHRFGYSEQQAISISLLYRLLEFWAPLLIGGITFFIHKDGLIIRTLPAIFIFISGLLYIISSIIPSYIPHSQYIIGIFDTLGQDPSNALIFLIGIVCIICSVFMIRGLRAAWYFGLIFCCFMVLFGLIQDTAYVDSIIAFGISLILLCSYKHYFVSNRKILSISKRGQFIFLVSGVILYGIAGFCYLQIEHFSMDFSIESVLKATSKGFILLDTTAGNPKTLLAHLFLYSLNLFGVLSISAILYFVFKPMSSQCSESETKTAEAQAILNRYGRSPVDYFKTYGDKTLFFNESKTGFISYKVSMGFAVALEGPVCEDDRNIIMDLIRSFEEYCRKKGLKVTYYRVDQQHLELYQSLGKKHFLIGEEAIVDVHNFNLQGKKRKSLRNAVNNIDRKGYRSECYRAPLSDEFIERLRLVSDNWLIEMKRSERVFSQGMFDPEKIRDNDVITLEDAEGNVLAFLNIIPNYAPREATYDLIRKLDIAPGGNMDVLLLRFMDYCRDEGYQMLNMGLAPLSGFDKKNGVIESTISFLYNKNSHFKSTRGLREFKEKFEPHWVEKYIVYSYDIDLLAAPLVLSKVMRNRK
ncbi:phosphatidylglycerol lysyltransferase domain-containing protein [Sphingobacterium sp. lm-10]|uniref:phosphatidylglycerol lysyltransferase domain-containing protein n=1 Tax=Sphingobacterium sp. lm-10 TaxID=2944904 RepID=UPI002021A912|nr:phosphatidylglycerol lysyltransferase domain-containing protein [Sphingobacterium sp. lm-10]MCL7986647.1 phosphatidylglycerol lysyltransferase domain-containing protein [Sphingobacterium sp. lm-10]